MAVNPWIAFGSGVVVGVVLAIVVVLLYLARLGLSSPSSWIR